jgi:site-specific recombinase XerD
MARLIEQVRAAIRVRQYSLATERSYLQRVRRFILFHGKRHPGEMGKEEVEAFLTYLAVRRGVSPSTQDQALQASLFLYRNVLQMELLGHKDVKATMIYTHVVQGGAFGARSPLDIALRSTDSRGS